MIREYQFQLFVEVHDDQAPDSVRYAIEDALDNLGMIHAVTVVGPAQPPAEDIFDDDPDADALDEAGSGGPRPLGPEV